MFIVCIDFKGKLRKKDVGQFLEGIRISSFNAIPLDTRKENSLDFNTDCIAAYVSPGLVGRLLGLLTSGKFPAFLTLICFSAKKSYIPHDADVIAEIAAAAKVFMLHCQLFKHAAEVAAWCIPFPMGKWEAGFVRS